MKMLQQLSSQMERTIQQIPHRLEQLERASPKLRFTTTILLPSIERNSTADASNPTPSLIRSILFRPLATTRESDH